jgi:hypothetical protein
VEVFTATMSRRISGLPEGGDWPLKKVARSHRARPWSQRALAVAGEPLRRQDAGVHRRERVPHLHDTSQGEGSQREAGVRQGAEESGQEPDLDRFDHPGRTYGRGNLHQGFNERRGRRGLCGGLPGSDVEGRTDRRVRRAGAHKTKKVRELIEGRERISCFCHPTHRTSIP